MNFIDTHISDQVHQRIYSSQADNHSYDIFQLCILRVACVSRKVRCQNQLHHSCPVKISGSINVSLSYCAITSLQKKNFVLASFRSVNVA